MENKVTYRRWNIHLKLDLLVLHYHDCSPISFLLFEINRCPLLPPATGSYVGFVRTHTVLGTTNQTTFVEHEEASGVARALFLSWDSSNCWTDARFTLGFASGDLALLPSFNFAFNIFSFTSISVDDLLASSVLAWVVVALSANARFFPFRTVRLALSLFPFVRRLFFAKAVGALEPESFRCTECLLGEDERDADDVGEEDLISVLIVNLEKFNLDVS